MLELHAFGDSLIKAADRDVRPSSPMMFAVLLYLIAHRGRPIPRQQLQELLFEHADRAAAAHSLRQLLYKIKKLDVCLETTPSFVRLAPSQATAAPVTISGSVAVLPGYEPDLPPRFLEWLETFRATLIRQLRATLGVQLEAARARGDVTALANAADSLLSLDPLNEDATLARAEALAFTGQKAEALRLLDTYAAEVGHVSEALRFPVEKLRKRILGRLPSKDSPTVPLIGRERDLEDLLLGYRRSRSGIATLMLLYGEGGIGKTRLLEEFRTVIALEDVVAIHIQCATHDAHRPLGAIIDVVPQLMSKRGALGVAPDTLSLLHRITTPRHHAHEGGPPELVAGTVRQAIDDLFLAVAAETALVITVEDAHWLDEISLLALRDLVGREVSITILATSRAPLSTLLETVQSAHTRTRYLEPLSDDAAKTLMQLLLGSDFDVTALYEQCVSLAGGNPLFLCAISEHLRQSGSAPNTSASIQDLLRQRCLRLTPHALLILRAIAALDAHCTYPRLLRTTQSTVSDCLLALQELSSSRLIIRNQNTIRCAHGSLTHLVRTDTPAAIEMALMARTAQVLEEDGSATAAASVLWACADYWELAGEPDKAAIVLRECSRASSDLGQASFAIDALRRAETLATDRELVLEIVRDAIRVADEASLDVAVHDGLRRLRHIAGHSDVAQLGTVAVIADINARRRSWRSIGRDMASLRQCFRDSSALPIDRLRAARIYLMAAEEELDAESAHSIHLEVQQELLEIRSTTAWQHYLLTYHGTFGDLSEASSIAAEVAHSATGRRKQPYHSLGHVAFVQFRAGAWAQAKEILLRLLEVAAERGPSLTLANHATQLCMMALQMGDYDLAVRCHEKSGHALKSLGQEHSAPHLANAIELALIARDAAEARSHHQRLCSLYGDCFTPNRERIALGHELTFDWLDGSRPTASDLSRAEALFRRGATVFECDTLAIGLSMAYHSAGRTCDANALLLHYLGTQRRERYGLPPFLAAVIAELPAVSEQGDFSHLRPNDHATRC
jgi:DNA-binding SARP family transcriptional activator/tetratricopeptide (TPR) repeat protein